MSRTDRFHSDAEVQWCPGCPNFGILTALKKALSELNQSPRDLCLVSGIGQAAKLPHYLACNFFNGLHGRAIPVALGIQAANPELITIVTTGEGDCYGEGGNHLLHTLRRNPDLTLVIHNNEIYALTKGQASPTTPAGEPRSLHPQGLDMTPLNLPAIAVLHEAALVARGFALEPDALKGLLVAAISTPGLALVEVVQPCITWNPHPLSWYRERIRPLPAEYDPTDKAAALELLDSDAGRYTVGILYRGRPRPLYGTRFRDRHGREPLARKAPESNETILALLAALRPAT